MGKTGPKYHGPLGRTARQRILYLCETNTEVSVEVFTQINAETDPELADDLLAEVGPMTVEDPKSGVACPLHIRRIFHDPSGELFVLVLTDAHRHRELECRAELYLELAKSPESIVPHYVRDFEVAYYGVGISALREARQERANLETASVALKERSAELEARASELTASENEFNNIEAELDRRETELARSRAELSRERSEFARERSAANHRNDDVLSSSPEPQTQTHPQVDPVPPKPRETKKGMPQVVVAPDGEIAVGNSDVANTSPFDRVELQLDEDGETYLDPLEPEEVVGDEVFIADELVAEPIEGAGDSSTQIGGMADVAIERWISSREPALLTLDEAGNARFAISVPERSLEGLLSKDLKVMLQLHQMATYPLITLSIGTPEGFGKGRPAPATFHFNVGETTERAVVEALAHDFTFQIDLFDTEYLPVRKRTITAGLAPNAQYVLSAADDALAKVKKRTEPSYTRALLAYDAPNYDRFGRMHPERKEFREDVLVDLSKLSRVRWAIHVCRRFSTTEGQEYLFLTRGYPLRLWQSRRRSVIRRASELGLWMGNTLAGIAISEGIAGSRKELIERMARNFVDGLNAAGDHDIDEDTVRDNWAALTEELRVQGFDPGTFMSPRSEAISSELQDVASGTIGPVAALSMVENSEGGLSAPRALVNGTLREKTTDELVALLGDRDRRYEAALELCRASTPSAVRPLFSALRRMTRAEAGHVFGGVISFGDAAVPHLIETLGSRKGFLRQGAALALAALGAEGGIEPVCNLLVSEPTDIWKEVARAVGEYGPNAVMPLCSHLHGGSEVAHERIAWALAHVASRGDRIAIDTLAGGRDPLAAGVARHALELADLARSDNRSIWNPRPGREHTVKRAFSKRVFEAMPKSPRGVSEISAPAMALNDSDILDASDLEEDVEQLDESDLLPT